MTKQHDQVWDDSTSTSTRGYLTIRGNAGNVVNTFVINGAVTDGSGYYKIPVAYLTGTLPANNSVNIIQFSRTGNVGATGAQGTTGLY